ncbi:helix-turn-helix transcriptional regulator [Falsiroseomonas tokyonensis]|uniref:Helix-turn-helix transcriptional regulator n=1 Tax=Falsiroseomonas tokyonensis TaxID=430521 RepID=A0ABV7BPP8_9PROT|nr:helix-turn-helix transcriptional regulator [Falsiroseomonas tokyonensis]MBU8536624.1 helix-turn-helix domain-containing protein [Falsiroseomonas tokyonensis]
MPKPALGAYLRDRRERLDPAAFGLAGGRRRTPGLRREEVAQRAGISATWYIWLEQGRGGAPSAAVLDRVARALTLTDAERDHLFLLGLGRLPAVQARPMGEIPSRLQRVLDALGPSPALIATMRWDVVAWNAAASLVLTDYAALPAEERNVLRRVFLDEKSRRMNLDWEGVARMVVAVLRAGLARTGAGEANEALVREMRQASADFARIWDEGDVCAMGQGLKRLRHPILGEIALEYSAFAVDGQPELTMLVFTPAEAADAARIRTLLPST